MAIATDAVKAKKLKEYWITFNSGVSGDNSDVQISHNHVLNVYQRNQRVKINEHFLGVLKDAVIETVQKDKDGKEIKVRIPTYTYSVEEIAEG